MSNAMEIGTTLYRARSSLFIGYMDHGNVRVDIYSFVVTAITRSGYWLEGQPFHDPGEGLAMDWTMPPLVARRWCKFGNVRPFAHRTPAAAVRALEARTLARVKICASQLVGAVEVGRQLGVLTSAWPVCECGEGCPECGGENGLDIFEPRHSIDATLAHLTAALGRIQQVGCRFCNSTHCSLEAACRTRAMVEPGARRASEGRGGEPRRVPHTLPHQPDDDDGPMPF